MEVPLRPLSLIKMDYLLVFSKYLFRSHAQNHRFLPAFFLTKQIVGSSITWVLGFKKEHHQELLEIIFHLLRIYRLWKRKIPPFLGVGFLRVRGIIMTPHFKQAQPLQGLLEEQFISFNIERSLGSYSQFPKKVILLLASPLKKRSFLASKKRPSET